MNKKTMIHCNSFPIMHIDKMLEIFLFEHGFSIYKGVTVLWDEDYDNRVFEVIDYIESCEELENLIAIEENQGGVRILWRDNSFDECFEEGKNINISNDTWSIIKSVILLEDEEHGYR